MMAFSVMLQRQHQEVLALSQTPKIYEPLIDYYLQLRCELSYVLQYRLQFIL